MSNNSKLYNDNGTIFSSDSPKPITKSKKNYIPKPAYIPKVTKRRMNLIFPIFTLLDILMILIAGLSGYGGWAAMAFIVIFPGILIIGVILAVFFDKNYDEKVTDLVGKIGYYIFPALYTCIILLGFFFVGDNGDGEGTGSTYSVLFNNSSTAATKFSYTIESIVPNIFLILLLILAASLVTYYSMKRLPSKQQRK